MTVLFSGFPASEVLHWGLPVDFSSLCSPVMHRKAPCRWAENLDNPHPNRIKRNAIFRSVVDHIT